MQMKNILWAAATFAAGAAWLSLAAPAAHAADDQFDLICAGGSAMDNKQEVPGGGIVIPFARADKTANQADPKPGQCALRDKPFPGFFQKQLVLVFSTAGAADVLAATRAGGTFEVRVAFVPLEGLFVGKQLFMTSVISTGTGGSDEDDVAVEEPDDGGNGGGEADDGDGHCPAMEATVSIPEPDDHKLNIRDRPNGKVLGTVAEGKQVTVIGHCAGEGAAGIVAGATKVDHNWCAIEEPMEGCVRRKYLAFDGDGQDGTAGAVANKRKKN